MLPAAITYLDYFGTVIFAVTGCLVAAKRQSDILAFILLGLATAVGGGTIRDILIGRFPVFWIQNPLYLAICIVTAIVMFFGLRRIVRARHYERFLVWSDAIGLATFTIIGTHIALMNDIAYVPAALLGCMTACFGSVIRDVISNDETLILRNDIYMTASLAGAGIYIAVVTHIGTGMAVVAGFATTFIIRGMAIQYGLKLPGHQWFETESK